MVSSDSDLLLSFLGFLLLYLGGGGGLLCEGDLQVGGRETETTRFQEAEVHQGKSG